MTFVAAMSVAKCRRQLMTSWIIVCIGSFGHICHRGGHFVLVIDIAGCHHWQLLPPITIGMSSCCYWC